MAIIQVNFLSTSLKRIVPFTAVIPNDTDLVPRGDRFDRQPDMKTLYLLHGYMGNHTDWTVETRIHEYARRYNVAVIMPSGENSFFLDDEDKNEYFGEYIGRELVEYTRKLLGLSHRREDTFIAGLSMGGYGALRTGLKYSQTFSKIMSFSAALIYLSILERKEYFNDEVTSSSYKERIFGDIKGLADSDKNPLWLVDRIRKSGTDIPQIMMTCGSEDSLIKVNQKLKNQLDERGVPVHFIVDSGIHDWDFWNKHLEEGLIWALRK